MESSYKAMQLDSIVYEANPSIVYEVNPSHFVHFWKLY